MAKDDRRLFTRRNFIGTGFLGAVSAYSYARWVEPNVLSVTRKEILLPNLPEPLDGTVVTLLTDFHYQPEKQAELMAQAVEVANASKADLVALTGDFITDSPDVFGPLMAVLKNLRPKHGVYGIMGNHDGWHGNTSEFQNGFKKAGFEFLINRGTRIEVNGESIHILGTDSIWAGKVDAPACYRGHKDEPVIALVHEPDVFDALRHEYRVDLQLSGHTHGGQCRVPLIGYAPVKVRYGQNYIHGEYHKGDSRIFVSRGLGTVGQPVRFACAPEVAILTLRSGRVISPTDHPG